MSLKATLKQIRELIDNGDNVGADKLIEEQLALGVKDYTLYLFAGVVKRNLGELSAALERYKAAIALDVDQLRAWQGAFALVTHSGWATPHDEFAVQIAERLILNAADQEKLALYKEWRFRFLLKLGSWKRLSELEAELAERDDLLLEAVRSLHLQIAALKSQGPALDLAVRLLAHIEPSGPIDEASHRAATLLHCQVSSQFFAIQWITTHLKAFPRKADADILRHGVSLFSSELVLKALRTCVLPTPASQLADSIACYLLQTNGTDTTDTDLQMASIIVLINDKKLGEANSLLTGYALSTDQLRRWPVKGVALYLYWQLCQFHKISQLLEADVTSSVGETPEITAVLRDAYWESRARLVELPDEYRLLVEKLHGALTVNDGSANSATLKKLLVLAMIESKQLSTMGEFNSTVSELKVESTSTMAYLRVYFVLNAMGDAVKALDLLKAPALTNVEGTALPLEKLDIALLSAKCAMGARRRDRALNELLAAVKMNAYFPDTFILLGENLLAMETQLEKAKQCAERALLLKPSSERAARVLLSASEKLGASSEIRLKTLLQFLSEKPNSKWGLRQAANAEINLRQFPEASEHVQRLIRMNPGDEESLDTNRIAELCQLWTLLSEVYRQMGNFQSAVRATEAVLRHCPTSMSGKLQLLQLHQEMCRFEEAIVLGESILGAIEEIPTSLHGAIKLLHLHSLSLSVVNESTANRRSEEVLSRLEGIFKLSRNIEQLYEESCLYQKCIALALEALDKFNDDVLAECLAQWGLDSPLPVRSRTDVLRWRVNCLTIILKKNPRDPDNWASLATCLLSAYHLGGDKSLVERSVECFRRAILLTKSKLKRSQLYCRLGKTYVVAEKPSRAQHCFIRALQLNKHSANAWCLLALLYLHLTKNEEALTAAHHAQKLDSFLMEAWCAQALHAELAHHHEAMDLFRHCIVLKPTPVAVKKYAHHLAQRISGRSAIDSGSMIDFERVKDLYYTTRGRSDSLLHSLALLAEHFWYLSEAKQYIDHIGAGDIVQRDKERIDIKCSTLSKATTDPSLVRLRELYEQPVTVLFERLMSHSRVGDLISALKDEDYIGFAASYDSIHFAMLASAAIVFDMKFSPSVISVIGSVRPLHKLAEAYPPGLDKIVEEIRRFERQNVEERVLVRHDHLTERLFELLEKQRKHRETNPDAVMPTEDSEIQDGAG